jgi:uncharacterized protein (TIGR00369 family)
MMSLAEIAPDAPTDFEGLRQELRRRAAGGITSTLGIDLVEMSDGHAVFAGTPGRGAYNPIGTVHGGYAAALLDSACGCAVHTRLGPGERYSTLELKVAYHKAITDQTGEVRAEGRVVSMGRRAAFAEATLKDTAGRLLASATSTLLVMQP